MKLNRRKATIMFAENGGSLPSFAWPGGYPILYWVADNGVLCADCANGRNESAAGFGPYVDPEWRITDMESGDGYEHDMTCDHCGSPIVTCYLSEDPEECPEGCAKAEVLSAHF